MTPAELRALADEATKPWRIDSAARNSVLIGHSYKGTESQADARLIALAPDLARLCAEMAEALSLLLVAKREYKIEYAGHIPAKTEAEQARDLARAALAKLAELKAR